MHLRTLIGVALSAVLALCFAAPPATAQGAFQAIVVQSCGSVTLPLNDPAIPYMDRTGNFCTAGGSGGGGGASTVSGSQEQDVRATAPLNAATANAAVTTAINGQATVGYTFTGLTASGATLTYEQSIDGGTTWTGINAVNRGTGAFEATQTADGQIALSATGRTTIRVRVSTPGTGTITVATNVSVREAIMSLGSPLPPGGNEIGFAAPKPTTAFSVQRTIGIGGTGTNSVVTTTNGAVTNQQSPTNGTLAVLVSAVDAVNRRTVTNRGLVPCEVMPGATGYGTGQPLPAGGSFTFDAAGRTIAALYVACSTAGGDVTVSSY